MLYLLSFVCFWSGFAKFAFQPIEEIQLIIDGCPTNLREQAQAIWFLWGNVLNYSSLTPFWICPNRYLEA